MKILNLNEIKRSILLDRDLKELIHTQKDAFMDFSAGLYDVPSPMQFIFTKFGSDCHIKGGYKSGDKHFVLKIASSTCFGNNGALFIFDAQTGEIKTILQDNGFLTTLRTAIAGLIVLELIPWETKNIGIVGSGHLAFQIYDLIKMKYPSTNIILYARNKDKAAAITNAVCQSIDDLLKNCDVILTTTSSTSPFIFDIPLNGNKAIIALGSDDEHKSELLPDLFIKADMILVDSTLQAKKYGDIAKAVKAGIISVNTPIELGKLLGSSTLLNTKMIIADLSGIGAQDVAIAEFVLSKILAS